MSEQTVRPVKKKAVSGQRDPRWPKPRVLRWLEWGAIPAIIGLWFPDWIGAYGSGLVWYIPPLLPPFPPLLTYLGALILTVGCYQGIKGMGRHFKGVVAFGALAGVFALASIIAQTAGQSIAALVLTGFAAVSATAVLWSTIAKVADISQERRTRNAWWAITILTPVTAIIYLAGVFLYAADTITGLAVLRFGIVCLTLTFGVCRYGVHCYRTQTSIGAGFVSDPNDQYWSAAK